MTIPSHHVEGDTGHTDDHNEIADVLSGQAADLVELQSTLAGLSGTFMAKAGNNTVTVSNPSGFSDTVVIPAGTRNGAAYVRTVTYGGRQTFGLDSYGQGRFGSAADDLTPLEAYGPSGQNGNLTNWRKGGLAGQIVASVAHDGVVSAPNITPTAWANLPLAGGIVTNGGSTPQYRAIGDMVYLRGNVKKHDSSPFYSSPADLGTVPSGFVPPHTSYHLLGASFASDEAYVRAEIQSGSGLLRVYFRHGSYQPTWIALDGIVFSRT
jgi:hypothetical protein